MFNSRSLRIAFTVIIVAILAIGVWWAIREKSNNDKTIAQNETGQTKKSNDTIAEVDVDQEKKHEIQSDAGLIIAGVVRDQEGVPVDGVEMEIFPIQDWFLRKYTEGKFVANQQVRNSSASIRGNLFIARHTLRNLAASVELDEKTKTLDVKLEPGVILTGKVVDSKGKGIEGARIAPILQRSNWRSAIPGLVMRTDTEGKFNFRALPPGHTYSLTTVARGYRTSKIEVNSGDAHDNRIDIDPIVLARGEFSISGVVVDLNDKPVADVGVLCTGKGQPGAGAVTDAEGKFKLEGIFEGNVQITAGLRHRGYGSWDLWGSTNTEAKATNVKVVLNNQGVPPPKGRTCFPTDIDVWINGAIVLISDVVVGQTVGEYGCSVPTAAFGHIEKVEEHEGTFECRDIVLDNGNRISVVDAHCFMLDSGKWLAAQDLRDGMKLKTLNGAVTIQSVTIREKPYVGKVYNLKIQNSDRYMVGKDGVIVRDY
jgi:hypothetical protein